jgi:hypothetical protein
MEQSEFERQINDLLKKFEENRPERMKQRRLENQRKIEQQTPELPFKEKDNIYDASNPEHAQIVKRKFDELINSLNQIPPTIKQIKTQYGK